LVYNQPWYDAFREAESAFYDAKYQYDAKVYGDKYNKGPEIKDSYPKASVNEKALLAKFNTLPEGDGEQGGNYSRRLFLEANPALSRYFDKTREYKNKKKLRLAKQYGIDVALTESFNTSVGYDDLGTITQPVDQRIKQEGKYDALGRRYQ
jgi:hypothetical protein